MVVQFSFSVSVRTCTFYHRVWNCLRCASFILKCSCCLSKIFHLFAAKWTTSLSAFISLQPLYNTRHVHTLMARCKMPISSDTLLSIQSAPVIFLGWHTGAAGDQTAILLISVQSAAPPEPRPPSDRTHPLLMSWVIPVLHLLRHQVCCEDVCHITSVNLSHKLE